VPAPGVAAAALAVAAALAAVPARAAEEAAPAAADLTASQGFVLSARGGWAAPAGDLSDEPGAALDAVVRGKIPIWFEVGYRLARRFQLGLFLEYAHVELDPDACLDACDGRSVRFGVDLQLQLLPGRRLAPWLGAGVALEFLDLENAVDVDGDGAPDADGERSFAGLELPLLEAGVDVVLSHRVRIGPYVAFSPAQFTTVEVEAPGAPGTRERIERRATHAWLQGGLKVTLDL
jgi:hypothetical protein